MSFFNSRLQKQRYTLNALVTLLLSSPDIYVLLSTFGSNILFAFLLVYTITPVQ